MSTKLRIYDQKLAAAGKRAYRVGEACYALGIGRTSLYDLIKNKEIIAIKIAGRTLIPSSEIERLTRVDRAA
jgi:excisionase family DNA binding protein